MSLLGLPIVPLGIDAAKNAAAFMVVSSLGLSEMLAQGIPNGASGEIRESLMLGTAFGLAKEGVNYFDGSRPTVIQDGNVIRFADDVAYQSVIMFLMNRFRLSGLITDQVDRLGFSPDIAYNLGGGLLMTFTDIIRRVFLENNPSMPLLNKLAHPITSFMKQSVALASRSYGI